MPDVNQTPLSGTSRALIMAKHDFLYRYSMLQTATRQACGKWVLALCSLIGCIYAPPAAASTLEAINHTHWAINHFSVDGRSGIDIIGPYQGGGGGCCYIAPKRWRPGMTVRVDWETGVGGSKGFPGFADRPKYQAWVKEMDAQTRRHSKTVLVPDYTKQDVCGITVHFLPCDDIQVTTSCYAYGSPEYPIKTALRLPEPDSCPVSTGTQEPNT